MGGYARSREERMAKMGMVLGKTEGGLKLVGLRTWASNVAEANAAWAKLQAAGGAFVNKACRAAWNTVRRPRISAPEPASFPRAPRPPRARSVPSLVTPAHELLLRAARDASARARRAPPAHQPRDRAWVVAVDGIRRRSRRGAAQGSDGGGPREERAGRGGLRRVRALPAGRAGQEVEGARRRRPDAPAHHEPRGVARLPLLRPSMAGGEGRAQDAEGNRPDAPPPPVARADVLAPRVLRVQGWPRHHQPRDDGARHR